MNLKESRFQLLLSLIMFLLFVWIYSNIRFKLSVSDLNFYVPFLENRLELNPSNTSIQYIYQSFYSYYSSFLHLTNSVLYKLSISTNVLTLGYLSWIPSIVFYWVFSLSIFDILNFIKKELHQI